MACARSMFMNIVGLDIVLVSVVVAVVAVAIVANEIAWRGASGSGAMRESRYCRSGHMQSHFIEEMLFSQLGMRSMRKRR